MRIAGIIAEYNPFHKGHEHQIIEIKKLGFDAVVAVMSPSVVQRGTAACMPVNVRVKAALACGVDLVISIPAPYAVMSAEGFAKAGVQLLSSLGIIEALVFGSEVGDTKKIVDTASIIEQKQFTNTLVKYLSSGEEYAKAAFLAVQEISPQAAEVLKSPNNLLGVEYCRALYKQHSTMKPIALMRNGAAHDGDLTSGFNQSASALRKILHEGKHGFANYVPIQCVEIYQDAIEKGYYIDENKFEIAVLSRLRAMSVAELSKIRLTNEGLQHRLFNSIQKANTLQNLYELLKCKRYAHSRMRRLVLDAALGYEDCISKDVPYIHALGASSTGQDILKLCNALLPISTSLSVLKKATSEASKIVKAHTAAESLVGLCMHTPLPANAPYTQFFQKQ